MIAIALAISAFYELIEWWAALLLEADANDFLGTQGDVWDTQWDMFLALCGAILAQLTLAGVHAGRLHASGRRLQDHDHHRVVAELTVNRI